VKSKDPKFPAFTLPFSVSAETIPANSSVIGIGTVTASFQLTSFPLTMPSVISAAPLGPVAVPVSALPLLTRLIGETLPVSAPESEGPLVGFGHPQELATRWA
jgi:hypothetical protein